MGEGRVPAGRCTGRFCNQGLKGVAEATTKAAGTPQDKHSTGKLQTSSASCQVHSAPQTGGPAKVGVFGFQTSIYLAFSEELAPVQLCKGEGEKKDSGGQVSSKTMKKEDPDMDGSGGEPGRDSSRDGMRGSPGHAQSVVAEDKSVFGNLITGLERTVNLKIG